jgi:hypothetical protein
MDSTVIEIGHWSDFSPLRPVAAINMPCNGSAAMYAKSQAMTATPTVNRVAFVAG